MLPFAVLVPFRSARIAACLAELFFQLCIVGTGNYAWINWIGALPCLALLDDRFLTSIGLFSAATAAEASAAEADSKGLPQPAPAPASVPAPASSSSSCSSAAVDQVEETHEDLPSTPKRHADGSARVAPNTPGGSPVDAASLLRAVAASPDTPKGSSGKRKARAHPNGGSSSSNSSSNGSSSSSSTSNRGDTPANGAAEGSPGTQQQAATADSLHPTSGLGLVINVCYRRLRAIVHLALLAFILGKSAAPMKELFGKAPWLSYYDDYFFVNAQGVFGFINQHRVTLVLHYTHDTLPPVGKDLLAKMASCKDPPGNAVRTNDGRSYTCAQVVPYCSSNPHLSSLCPKTCGGCPAREWSDADIESIAWSPLHFKNLPGDLRRMPSINSPYVALLTHPLRFWLNSRTLM